jgi:cell wall assembly regulator SMI1
VPVNKRAGEGPSLREELARLEASWEGQRDLRLSKQLLPGADAAEVIDVLGSADLPAPGEAIDWFGWRNGARRETYVHRLVGISNLAPMSLNEAVGTTELMRQINLEQEHPLDDPYWRPTWIPLLATGGGDYLVIEPGTQPCAVLMKGRDERAAEAPVVAPSFAALVAYWTRLIDTGEWLFRAFDAASDDGSGYWESISGTDPPMYVRDD